LVAILKQKDIEIVGEAADGVARHADADADERRDVPPGAEIDIGVGHEQPFRFAGVVVVRQDDGAEAGDLLAVEMRVGAIFRGRVEAQPVVQLIADAEIDDRRASGFAPTLGVRGRRLASPGCQRREDAQRYCAHR